MGVEDFGVNLYLLQIIFGGVDIPAKFITILSLSYLGRHTTEVTSLLLAGMSILALLLVPSGEEPAPCQCTCSGLSLGRPRLGGAAPGLGSGILSQVHCVTLSRSLGPLGLTSLI